MRVWGYFSSSTLEPFIAVGGMVIFPQNPEAKPYFGYEAGHTVARPPLNDLTK